MRRRLDEIEPGTALCRDLVQDGHILLSTGSVLTASMLATLKRRGLAVADVVCDDADRRGPPASLATNPEYERERAAIEGLFASIGEKDGQMQMLKYCLIGQLQDAYRDES